MRGGRVGRTVLDSPDCLLVTRISEQITIEGSNELKISEEISRAEETREISGFAGKTRIRRTLGGIILYAEPTQNPSSPLTFHS